MKQIDVCLICGKGVSKSLAYKANVKYLAKNFMTGEQVVKEMQGSICPMCNTGAGYKTAKKKLAKFV